MSSLVFRLPKWFRAAICLTACLTTLIVGAPIAVFCCAALCKDRQEAFIFEGGEHCEQMEFEVRDCCMQKVYARYRMESQSDSCCHQGKPHQQDSSAMLRLADAPTLAVPESKLQALSGNRNISIKYTPIQIPLLEKSDTYLRCCVFLI